MREIIVAITAEISKEFRFEAAHFLPNVAVNHQCRNIHGHSYRLVIRARGPIDNQTGWVMDLSELSRAFEPIKEKLDHKLLNEVEGLANPTGEAVAVWIFRKLEPEIPTLSSITVEATNRISITISKDSFQ